MASKLEQLQTMSQADLIKRLMDLESQPKRASNRLSLKVGEKGGISVYGVGRFPMTAYAETWVKVLDIGPEIVEFIKANRDTLKFKNGIPSLDIPASEQAAETDPY